MRRLVSVRVFYVLGVGYIALGKEGKMYSLSLATCLFLAFIACVRETTKVSDFVALYSSNCKFVTKGARKVVKYSFRLRVTS